MRCCVLTALVALIAQQAHSSPPNILFAVADDMSHASAYGHKFLSTPNFDAIARQGLRFNRMYYMHNFEPERWPCGTAEAGFRDIDGSPTKSAIWKSQPDNPYHRLCFGKRPQAELYNVVTDPDCMDNLAANPQHGARVEQMKSELFAELEHQQDPRVTGHGYDFDYARPDRLREYGMLVEKYKGK
ncbi:heparan N-sulfatase [Rhodopirellula maiorica SM1]|uniref:Heparan N-sulfatase n=2 Tax=Novipirellula TaxID=2795426 RepID=M5RC18_9BACT|nr:heparan N-sulfatase [Rhodopirellula maiorica SM1]